ncbi:MAG: hypothetical protein RDV48_05815 [Candidatus Eremiobacteraeota bacterium]|nr:hypothetical protein [Candidatus Eremiobacteraeota bacterium]
MPGGLTTNDLRAKSEGGETVATYFSKLNSGSVEGAYDLFSSDYKARKSLEGFRRSLREAYYILRTIDTIKSEDTRAEISTEVLISPRGDMTVLIQNDPLGEKRRCRFSLIKEGGQWKIDSATL